MATALIVCIRIYQKMLSGVWGARCIYTPSCSQYGIEALHRFGVVRGTLVLFFRIIRCVPRLYAGGADPLKESYTLRELVWSLRPTRASAEDASAARASAACASAEGSSAARASAQKPKR